MNTTFGAIKECKISNHIIEVSIQMVNLVLMSFEN